MRMLSWLLTGLLLALAGCGDTANKGVNRDADKPPSADNKR